MEVTLSCVCAIMAETYSFYALRLACYHLWILLVSVSTVLTGEARGQHLRDDAGMHNRHSRVFSLYSLFLWLKSGTDLKTVVLEGSQSWHFYF